MHLFNTVVETYIYTYTSARSVPLKYTKLQKQIEKKVYIYKYTTGPDGNFWIEKACKPRENGRPDDDVLCRALIVDTLSFIQCPYIIISLFIFLLLLVGSFMLQILCVLNTADHLRQSSYWS